MATRGHWLARTLWICAGFLCLMAVWQVGTNLSRPDKTATLTDIADPSWSPDGREIVFSARAEGATSADLWVIDIADQDPAGEPIGTPVQITSSALDEVTPSWGPAGRIAYSTSEEPTGAIQTVLENGSDPVQLTHGDERGTLPTWDATGRKVAFICPSPKGTGLCVINDRFSGFELLAESAVVARPSWSRERSTIAYNDSDGIIEVDPSGGRQALITDGIADGVAWSADGAQLVANMDGKLWIIDAATQERTEIDIGALEIAGAPAWSDNGIAFVGVSSEGRGLYVFEDETLTPVVPGAHPSRSPNARGARRVRAR